MRRRANGEGTVRRRQDGRWECQIVLGDGRRKSVYGRTQHEALRKMRDVERAQDQGDPIATGHQTVGAYLSSWLEAMRPNLRPRTWTRYEQLVRVHGGAISGLALTKLAPEHLERLYADRIAAGVGAMTVRHLHARLHRALTQAARRGLVGRNVASLVSPPRAPRHEMVTLTEEQTRAFLRAATGERLEGLYVLAVTTGMRQGELLALRWANVDIDGGSLQVRQSLQFVGGGEYVFTAPKTAKSRRKVELTKVAVAALRRHRALQVEERLAAAGGWEDLDLVFANEVGRPIDGTNLARRSYARILKRAGLKRIRFHDLRHTAATLLLGRGINPKIVSEQLGHAQIAITLDLYSHVTPTMQREAVNALDAVLEGHA